MVMTGRTLTMAAVVLVATWSSSPRAAAHDGAVTEYQVKAVYLLNFARFVTWPEGAFASPSTPLTVCILGHDPFGSALDQTLANETIGGRPLQARRIGATDGVEGCQLLFLGGTAAQAHASLVRALDTRPVLTVGDDEAFARAGGMVGLRVEEGTVRISVNPDALRQAGLTMSSQLLRIARIVSGAS